MEQTKERQLLRRLQEGSSAVEAERLEATWDGLEGPAPAPAPADFVSGVLARLEPSPGHWPMAMRWAATGVVALGVAVGTVVGQWVSEDDLETVLPLPGSLAETYVGHLDSSAPEAGETRR